MNDIEKRLLLLESSLNHLIDSVENNAILLKDMPVELARTKEQLRNLTEEVKQQREKLHVLESKPRKHWETAIAAIISAVCTAIVGFVISSL